MSKINWAYVAVFGIVALLVVLIGVSLLGRAYGGWSYGMMGRGMMNWGFAPFGWLVLFHITNLDFLRSPASFRVAPVGSKTAQKGRLGPLLASVRQFMSPMSVT